MVEFCALLKVVASSIPLTQRNGFDGFKFCTDRIMQSKDDDDRKAAE